MAEALPLPTIGKPGLLASLANNFKNHLVEGTKGAIADLTGASTSGRSRSLIKDTLAVFNVKDTTSRGMSRGGTSRQFTRVDAPSLVSVQQQIIELAGIVKQVADNTKQLFDELSAEMRQLKDDRAEAIIEAPYKRKAKAYCLALTFALWLLDNIIGKLISGWGGGGGGGLIDSVLGTLGSVLEGAGIASLFKRSAGKFKLRKGVTSVETPTGARYRDPKTGRFIKAEEAIKPGLLKSIGSTIKGAGAAVYERVAAPLIAPIASSRFAAKIGSMFVKAEKTELGKTATSAIVKRLAIPIVGRAVGKTVIKSIPIVGGVVGIGFAIKRLAEGDVVGAGLDAASGLAGPMTAIPALIASVSRDIYKSVYNIQPEDDPLFAKRMPEVTASVKQVVEDQLRQVVKPLSPGTSKSRIVPPLLPKPPQLRTPDKQPTIPRAVAPVAKPAPTATRGTPARPASPAAPAPRQPHAAASHGAQTSSSSHGNIPPAIPKPNVAPVGMAIAATSVNNDFLTLPGVKMPSIPNAPPPGPGVKPSQPTASMSEVPDPTYDFHAMLPQMFFGTGR